MYIFILIFTRGTKYIISGGFFTEAYKDKGGCWYVSVRNINWLGEPSHKTKRGFTTKRDSLAWEREFLQKSAGSLDMTFNSFVENEFVDNCISGQNWTI